jgi:UPF0042 nucleotide-binding protein
MNERPTRLQLVIISGASGSGKTTALHSFEDAGYFTVDNLPPALLPSLATFCLENDFAKVAVVVDARVREAVRMFEPNVRLLRDQGHSVKVLFLDTEDHVLVARFKESRRPHPFYHPLAQPQIKSIEEAIEVERTLLEEVRAMADRVVDTTTLTPTALRHQLQDMYADTDATGMQIVVLSFGYKYGIPVDADLVFDVRFLCNPHYVPELQAHDGRDDVVKQFVFSDPRAKPLLEKMEALIDYTLPEYEAEGKAYLTIAIGCTGGKHRSVVLAEALAAYLRGRGAHVAVRHRDLPEPSQGKEA